MCFVFFLFIYCCATIYGEMKVFKNDSAYHGRRQRGGSCLPRCALPFATPAATTTQNFIFLSALLAFWFQVVCVASMIQHIVFSERIRELTFTFAILCYRPSVCLSVVCNARAPYSGGSNFRQYFIRYFGHPLTSAENFTEIVPREPLCRGVKHKRGSQV